jgi:hypothetical protein
MRSLTKNLASSKFSAKFGQRQPIAIPVRANELLAGNRPLNIELWVKDGNRTVVALVAVTIELVDCIDVIDRSGDDAKRVAEASRDVQRAANPRWQKNKRLG